MVLRQSLIVMRYIPPPEELDTQVPDKQHGGGSQLLTSLLLGRRGWFANLVLYLTAAGRRGCNQRAPWSPSL